MQEIFQTMKSYDIMVSFIQNENIEYNDSKKVNTTYIPHITHIVILL